MPDVDADPHILGPGLHPTPFSADEIRAGSPDGRLLRMEIEADGQVTGSRTNLFTEGDPEGATLVAQVFDTDGRPIGPPTGNRVAWRQFQGHASFPVADTTRGEERIETPLGVETCLRYVQVEGDERSTYWFAPSRPGMPIRYQSEVGGRVVSRVTVIADERT